MLFFYFHFEKDNFRIQWNIFPSPIKTVSYLIQCVFTSYNRMSVSPFPSTSHQQQSRESGARTICITWLEEFSQPIVVEFSRAMKTLDDCNLQREIGWKGNSENSITNWEYIFFLSQAEHHSLSLTFTVKCLQMIFSSHFFFCLFSFINIIYFYNVYKKKMKMKKKF